MKSIIKWNKKTGEKTAVTTEEFLSFVGSGPKRREKALLGIIEGDYYQNNEVAYYIEAVREVKTNVER